MTGLQIVILVCVMSLPRAECVPQNSDTRIQSVTAGPHVNNEIMCGLFGQSQIAQTAAAVKPRPGKEYLKVMCVRDRPASKRGQLAHEQPERGANQP